LEPHLKNLHYCVGYGISSVIIFFYRGHRGTFYNTNLVSFIVSVSELFVRIKFAAYVFPVQFL